MHISTANILEMVINLVKNTISIKIRCGRPTCFTVASTFWSFFFAGRFDRSIQLCTSRMNVKLVPYYFFLSKRDRE